jgi:hypothetical protein
MALTMEETELLRNWKRKNKLRKQEANNLLECYRRSNMFKNGNLTNESILLALPSEVNNSKKYVTCTYGREKPRANNWYKLTYEGMCLVSELKKLLTWNEERMNYYLHISNSIV